ncbi:MAG: hypothetical protein ACOC2U_02760 [bacterium]
MRLKMSIPKDKTISKRHSPKKTKTCAHPGCNKEFFSVNARKYCKEHMKQKYFDRYAIRQREKESKQILLNNQLIYHSCIQTTNIKVKCDCCNKEFELKLFPRVYIYPNFCPEHINYHKREMYKKFQLNHRKDFYDDNI